MLTVAVSGVPDGALGHQRPCLLVHGVPAHHVADGQLDAVLLAGRQHGPCLAQAAGHRFLTEDGERPIARGRQNRLRGVPARRSRDAEQVGLLLVQHLREVAVAAQGREIAFDAAKCGRIYVADRGKFDTLNLCVGSHVLETSPVEADHSRPQGFDRHQQPSRRFEPRRDVHTMDRVRIRG